MRIPECSVIIPVFNKWELTRNCLVSLREHSASHDLEVIVVDNASTDETASELAPLGKSLFGDRFSMIVFSENRNFGPACNAGARAATAPLLFFLNNDTLLTPDWAGPLLRAMNGDNAPGAVGPLLLYENDTVQHLGVAYNAIGPVHLYCYFPRNHPVVARARNLQALTGAAIMLPAALFRECGGFHEEYRNGYEDLELSVRLRERRKKLACVTASVVYHLESQTPGRKKDEYKNSALFFKRCGKAVYIDIHRHALRDGYRVFVNDMLTLTLGYTSEEEKRITASSRGKSISDIINIIAENPFWMTGPECLAEYFERNNMFKEAVMFRGKLADIEPLQHRYEDVLRLAPLVEEKPWLGNVEKTLRNIKLFRENLPSAKQKIRFISGRFKKGGDHYLESLYAEKMKEMFGGHDR